MRRTAPNYLPIASLNTRQYEARSGIEGALPVIGASIVWISFVFMVFPVIDLAVSRWFTDGQVFFLAEQPSLKTLRNFGRDSQIYIISAMVLLLVLHFFLPGRYAFCKPHKPLFVLMSFAAGPLLVVQSLKILIGRVRPRDIIEFGGSADFTPVWQFSAACARSCSFPSGESSAAAAGLSLLIFVPARLRWIAAIVLVPLLAMIAFNRVLFGAHFLSDILLGWLFTMLVMAWIWRWTEARSKSIDAFFTRRRR